MVPCSIGGGVAAVGVIGGGYKKNTSTKRHVKLLDFCGKSYQINIDNIIPNMVLY